ncbi:Uncharacterized protein SCF082_LOCUS36615 [Durusdinium trenchii]|uniref:Uncharacterized protein n=1 Tax=Durusdinium trenchii TaxID=1381693 RepID=A0ABP0PLQ0_9DINO
MRWLQNVRIFLHAAFGLSQDYFGVAEQKRIFPEPTDAAGWASRAFRASQSCEKALHQAQLKQAEAEKHAEIAQASTQQAQAAMLQAKVNSLAYAVKSPSLKPYLHFCQQIAERVRARPHEANSSAMIELRRFCAGLENFMDAASRRPETVATRSGLRLYDVPPKKYPEEPKWMQDVPEFHVPDGDLDEKKEK